MISFFRCMFPRKILKITNEPVKMPINNGTQEKIAIFAKENHLTLVDLSYKEISFRFDAHSCYFLNKGHCSLSLTEDEVKQENIPVNNHLCRGEDIHFCRNLLLSMQDENRMKELFINPEPITISKAICGHYASCSGQHRLCVAKHAGLIIPVQQNENNTNKCGVCRSEQFMPDALYK